MIAINLPSIAVQKVSNGYLVQWHKLNPIPGSPRTITVSAVCLGRESLVTTIDEAAADIDAIENGEKL